MEWPNVLYMLMHVLKLDLYALQFTANSWLQEQRFFSVLDKGSSLREAHSQFKDLSPSSVT